MNKILCIGEALIDMICTDTGKKLSEGDHFLKKAGGAPTNVAAAIAALGGSVALSAKVGDDPFGQHLIDTLTHFNVDTQWMLKDPVYFTTLAFVSLMENGERDFYFNRGADGQLSVKDVRNIDPADYAIVHFGSATAFLPGPLQTAYQGMLQRCLTENVFISFDPNYRNLLFGDNKESFIDQSWNFIMACHLFKLSEEEAMLITGKATVKDAADYFLKKTNAIFCITLGKEGTLLGHAGKTVTIPSIPVKAIDTTGAGDALVGAILYQLSFYTKQEIESLTAAHWEKIISNANKAGARTCEYMGAMEAFKHLTTDIFK